MPKRVVDGEAIWGSDKLGRVPEKFRAEFANLIPLALANGSFECDARKIWSRAYAYNRTDVTVEFVEEALDAFERAKMLFRWKDGAGKTWGYWVGIEKEGRLPSGTNQKHGQKGAEVPREALTGFLSGGTAACSVNGQSEAGQIPVDDRSGFGFGFGSGSGSGSGLGSGSGSGSCIGSGEGRGSGPGKGSGKGEPKHSSTSRSREPKNAGASPSEFSEEIRKTALGMSLSGSSAESATSERANLLRRQGEEIKRKFPASR